MNCELSLIFTIRVGADPNTEAFSYRKKGGVFLKNKCLDILFDSRTLISWFCLHIQYKVQVSEGIVFLLDVVEPTLVLCLELKSIESADKAPLFHIWVNCITRVSHICEGIDNDTEDQIKKDNCHQEEESQVEDIPRPVCVIVLIKWDLVEKVANTTACSQTIINSRCEALEQCATIQVLIWCILSLCNSIHWQVTISQNSEGNKRIDVNDDCKEDESIEKLFTILYNGLDDILQ